MWRAGPSTMAQCQRLPETPCLGTAFAQGLFNRVLRASRTYCPLVSVPLQVITMLAYIVSIKQV